MAIAEQKKKKRHLKDFNVEGLESVFPVDLCK